MSTIPSTVWSFHSETKKEKRQFIRSCHHFLGDLFFFNFRSFHKHFPSCFYYQIDVKHIDLFSKGYDDTEETWSATWMSRQLYSTWEISKTINIRCFSYRSIKNIDHQIEFFFLPQRETIFNSIVFLNECRSIYTITLSIKGIDFMWNLFYSKCMFL